MSNFNNLEYRICKQGGTASIDPDGQGLRLYCPMARAPDVREITCPYKGDIIKYDANTRPPIYACTNTDRQSVMIRAYTKPEGIGENGTNED